MKRVSILLTLIALSVGLAYAGGNTIHQNFHTMYNNGKMTVDASAKVATTDSVTYTYSGGTYSRFYNDSKITNGRIGLQLKGSGAKVVTTVINDLESVTVLYFATAKKTMKVSVSADAGGPWTELTKTDDVIGSSTYNMPSKGSYVLKIEQTEEIWLEEIDYTLAPPCNCLRVTVSE